MSELRIRENTVELDTDVVFSAIELKYNGTLQIENLLPPHFLIKKANNKILILRFGTDAEIPAVLFKYFGYCNIYYGTLIDKDLNQHQLKIGKLPIVVWNNLKTLEESDATANKPTWDYLTTDYEVMKNTLSNSKAKIKKLSRNTDGSSKVEYDDVVVRRYKKDKNMELLGNLHTSGREFQISGEKAPYSGSYHIDLRTNKVYTGSMPNKKAKLLISSSKKEAVKTIKVAKGGY